MASKEALVADAIADSCLGCLFGLYLRVKAETEIENIMNFFQQSPTFLLNTSNISVKFERGCGKMKMLTTVGLKRYNMSTLASTSDGKMQKKSFAR